MQLIEIDTTTANGLLEDVDGHYLGAVAYSPRFCIATPELDAVAVYSWPVAQHFKMKLHEPLELVRLWQAPGVKRQVSQFVGSSIRWIKKLAPESDCIFSYADPSQINPITGRPHVGTVYQATNFTYFGASRVTDYWEKNGIVYSSPRMYRMHKTKSRTKLIELGYTMIEKAPKHLYVYGLNKTADEVRDLVGGRYA